jgi:hypothetical protein
VSGTVCGLARSAQGTARVRQRPSALVSDICVLPRSAIADLLVSGWGAAGSLEVFALLVEVVEATHCCSPRLMTLAGSG